jgi:hypothetical protein
MGCDIHGFIDYNLPGDEYVSSLLIVDLGRNYDVFSMLANVRGFYRDSSAPKGLPKLISYEAGCGLADPDIHSQSWLTYDEYKNIIKEY